MMNTPQRHTVHASYKQIYSHWSIADSQKMPWIQALVDTSMVFPWTLSAHPA